MVCILHLGQLPELGVGGSLHPVSGQKVFPLYRDVAMTVHAYSPFSLKASGSPCFPDSETAALGGHMACQGHPYHSPALILFLSSL